MTVSLPMVALFGLILFFLLRARYLGWGAAFTAVLFGLYLGTTPAGAGLESMTASVAHAIAQAFH